jgi:nitrite reductase/ring-hydroxylating ferredoxin subunit
LNERQEDKGLVTVCTLAQTYARPIVPVMVGGLALLVIRDGERLYACERACPHEYIDLRTGRCGAGKIHCPRHRAWFDLETGAVSPGWDFPNLQVFPVVVRGEDVAIELNGS